MFIRKIIICICLLQVIVGGIFAQNIVLQIKIVNKNTDSVIKNANINTYCNGKFQQFTVSDSGIFVLPAEMQNCVGSVSALGFETLYNVAFKPGIENIFKLEKKNSALQEVIITGQTQNVLAENSIYKVQTITAKKLQQQAAQNLSEALSFENGINQQQDNTLGNALNIQGVGAQNVKILVNGIAMNGRENGSIDLSTININNAERIEYVKGPMSVMYGTDALGGVINIITKPAKKSFAVGVYAENINKLNTNFNFGFLKKRHTFSFNGARNFFGGWQTLDTFNRNLLWRPKLQYQADAQYVYATSKGKITYSPSFMQERIVNKGTPFVDPFEAYATDEYFVTQRHMHSLQSEFNLDSTQKINLTASVSIYNRVKNKYAINMVNLQRTLLSNIGDQDTSAFTDYTVRGTFNKANKKNWNWLFGFEANSQNTNSLKILNKTQTINDAALFASSLIKISNKINLQPAFRIARNSIYKTPLIPSLNLSAKLPNQNILRISMARGFRAPSLKELYLNFVDVNHKIKGNDSLQAEYSWHAQANLDYNVVATEKTKLKWNTSVFYNSVKNQIALAVIDAPTNWYAYANVNNFKNLAVESSLKFQKNKNIISLGFGANNIFTADSGKGISTWDVSLQENITIGKHNTNLNIFYKYIYKQPLLTLSTYGGDALYNSYLPAMHQANANVSQAFFKSKLFVQLGVKNILDIRNVTIQGVTNSTIHNSGTSQTISPARSYFVALKYGL